MPDARADNNIGTNWSLSVVLTDGAIHPNGNPFSSSDVGSPGFVPGLDFTPPHIVETRIDQNDANNTQRSMVRSVTVVFDQIVSVGNDAFEFVQRNVSNPIDAVVDVQLNVAEVAGRSEVRLSFSGNHVQSQTGSLVDGNYMLTIHGNKITGKTNGVQLDGDQDGSAGGNAVIGDNAADAFFRLFGDADGDRDVDGQDYGRFGLAFLTSAGQPGFDFAFDSDADGDIDGQDYGRFGKQFLKTLS